MTPIRYWPLFAFVVLAACSPAPEKMPAPLPQSEPLSEEEATVVSEAAPDVQPNSVAEPASCADELGAEAAQVLVDQCLAISPATRPPCNAQNSCDMIRDEIRRGCGFGDAPENPEFCGEYQ